MGAAVDDEEVSKNPMDVSNDTSNVTSVKFAYGEPIQEEVVRFYNFFNPEDNVLQPRPFYPADIYYEVYPFFEKDAALGLSGYQTSPNITLPKNYVQINVQDQIRAIHDGDAIEGEDFGLCKLFNIRFCQIKNEGWDFGLCNNLGLCKVDVGDNHAGYIGFRNLTNTNLLADDGAMNVVVKHWRVR